MVRARLKRSSSAEYNENSSYIVPKEVGKVGNQSADFLKPISERKGNISSFFAKPANSGTSDKKPEQISKPQSSPKAESKPSSRNAKGGSKKKEEDSVEVVKEEDLALNPDEVDKVNPESSIKKTGKESDDSTQKPIVLDEGKDSPASTKKAKAKGKKSEPIVLDDDSAEEEKPKPRSGSKRKRQTGNADGGRSQKAAKGVEEDTDGDGNEKVTSFFEVIDDA